MFRTDLGNAQKGVDRAMRIAERGGMPMMATSSRPLEALHKGMDLPIPLSGKPSRDFVRIIRESRADVAELLSVVGPKLVTECRNLLERQRRKR